MNKRVNLENKYYEKNSCIGKGNLCWMRFYYSFWIVYDF